METILSVMLLVFIVATSSPRPLSSSSSMAAAAATAVGEAEALIQFRLKSVESDPRGFLNDWTISNNSGSSTPCSWTGVLCSPASDGGRVSGLKLSNMGLAGRLGLENLMALPALRDLDLSGNLFYGNLSYRASSSSSLPCSFKSVDLSANAFNESIAAGFLSSCLSLASLNFSGNLINGGIYPFSASLQVLDLSGNRISDDGLLNYTLSSCGNLRDINLSNNKLAGRLRDVSACANLAALNLSGNSISGEIPPDFMSSSPASLQILDLSGNKLSGDISAFDFGACGDVRTLNFSYNNLNCTGLPPSLANCRQLETLYLSGNNFVGKIPSFWSSFDKLKHLYLANNGFSDEIPPELGSTCATLVELSLAGNSLSGGLPSTFITCSSLQSLDLRNNQLSGDFVGRVISNLRSLRYLYLPFNNISGDVPLAALTNSTLLETIDLSSNNFTGEIPAGLCSSLPNLHKLYLANNYISGSLPWELGSCSTLRSIDLSFNELSGPIPSEIWSLPKLVDVVIWANKLTGEISDNLCSNGAALETLILSYNNITGSIPSSITKCVNLIWVSLSGNNLTGSIPSDIGNLKSLAILQLGSNSLSGEIPPGFGSCRNLIWLDLAGNGLSGPIPPELAAQTGLIVPGIVSGKQFAFLRNAAGNICPGAGVLFEFAGIRPDRLASFAGVHSCPATRIYTGTTVYSFASNGSMIYLDLSYNALSGSIPVNFGSMSYLQVLNLGHNELTDEISESFGGLKMILELDLSHNKLTGYIPGELGTLTFLNDLDVSNNNLSGPIPTTGQLTTFPASRYENNSGLCGVPLSPCGATTGRRGLPLESGGKKKFFGGSILIGVILAVLVMLSLMVLLYKIKQHHKKVEEPGSSNYVDSLTTSGTASWKLSGVLEPLSINVATFEKPLRKLTFAHLLEATNGFSADSLIGSGGFGEVYKAKLKDGSVVAIKKLRHVTGQGDREFTAEMETIGKIKHRNLVPLLGYCKVGEERLLVYEYMRHGSLDVILHDKLKGSGTMLDWAARKKIAIGSARGLAFLHHSCIPHIIHRDMKSSNVLLDENLEARVSDFGMARLVNALDTHLSVSTLSGTPGYVPPEYYQSFRCTTKGDVYSYGVVLLELLTGRRPIEEFGDNNLVGWAKQMVKENRSNEIFDPELLETKSGKAELYQYLKIACDCLDDRTLKRPTMIQVMAMFKELQMDSDCDFLDGISVTRTIVDDESKE